MKTLKGIERMTRTINATHQIGSGRMPYWRNRSIDNYDPEITRAIIVIHGSRGNAEGYFHRINNIIPSTWKEKALVIAPHFQKKTQAETGELWWDGDWREGGASGGISSFAVVDSMVARLRNGTFPNLMWVVIAGHSAGGQFTQRYAAFTDINLQPARLSALVKFVPANPSSYVYLNGYRRTSDNTWGIPPRSRSEEGYNQFKFGLDNLYDYAADRGAEWARNHLPGRRVELLAGTKDVVPDNGFDDSRPAMWQGATRYERAHTYNAFMDRFFSANQSSVTSVPGVGHDSTAMFASPQGKNALFFAD